MDQWDQIVQHPASRTRAVPGFDADRLRTLRHRAMLTQAELASHAGISRGAVSHLEKGRRQPMVTTLRGLCLALDCELGDLVPNEGTEHDTATSQDEAESYPARAAV